MVEGLADVVGVVAEAEDGLLVEEEVMAGLLAEGELVEGLLVLEEGVLAEGLLVREEEEEEEEEGVAEDLKVERELMIGLPVETGLGLPVPEGRRPVPVGSRPVPEPNARPLLVSLPRPYGAVGLTTTGFSVLTSPVALPMVTVTVDTDTEVTVTAAAHLLGVGRAMLTRSEVRSVGRAGEARPVDLSVAILTP